MDVCNYAIRLSIKRVALGYICYGLSAQKQVFFNYARNVK